MSSRLYPTFKEGSKQLRVFLPNFWMKLVYKPEINLQPNQVQFIVSPQMTKFDIKQYLEKIYNIPVVFVTTTNLMGKTKTTPNRYITKEEDVKVAFVTLPKDHKVDFPQIFGESDSMLGADKAYEEAKALYAKKTKLNIAKQGVPSWFSH